VFADWVLEQLEVNPNFAKQIIFSDEAHFWMNGYVNKIVEFGTIPIHMRYTNSKCIPRKLLFGADFGLTESSVHISSKTKRCHNRQRALQIDDKQLLVA